MAKYIRFADKTVYMTNRARDAVYIPPFNFIGTARTSESGRWYASENIELLSCEISCGTAPTSDAQFTMTHHWPSRKFGSITFPTGSAVIVNFNLKAGQTHGVVTQLGNAAAKITLVGDTTANQTDVTGNTNDYVTAACVTAGGAKDVVIQLYGTRP